MGERIVEGLWDCPYCKTKGIGGLTKHCPCCGHPQDKGTKFYLGAKKHYLEKELAAQYGQGADWVCPYCGSLNRVRFKYCANCGAPKDASEQDYFSAKASSAGEASPDEQTKQWQEASSPVKPKKNTKKRRIILASVLALLALFLYLGWARVYDGTVVTATWARAIDIEAYRTVAESDWMVPLGGRITDQRTEFHHYEQVFDHYETRTRQVSRQEYDGSDYSTEYVDNGDGTFTERTVSSPRYKTVYDTETYREPVYRDEPVYATKYYYDIDKWVFDRTAESAGADDEPYWPDYTLSDNERTAFEGEVYMLTIDAQDKTYRVKLPQDMWSRYHRGDAVKITVVTGNVTKINDEEVPKDS